MGLKDSGSFKDQNELIEYFTDLLDLHIYFLYKYHSWVGPDNKLQNMMGVVVSREEFENNLLNASSMAAHSSLEPNEQDELLKMRGAFLERLSQTDEEIIPLMKLFGAFDTDEFQIFVIVTLVCCELNRKYEKLFAYLQDDITKKNPTAETLIQLFARPNERISQYYERFSEDGILAGYLAEHGRGNISSMTLRLSPMVMDFLLGTESRVYNRFYPDAPLHPLYINDDLCRNIANSAAAGTDKAAMFFLTGKKGSGRRFIAKHCAKLLDMNVLFVSIQELCSEDNIGAALRRIVCDCILHEGTFCLTGFEKLLDEEERPKLTEFETALAECSGHIRESFFITSEMRWQDAREFSNIVRMDIDIPDTDESMRLILWERFMEGGSFDSGTEPQEMAAKFRFSAGQIESAVQRSADLAKLTGSGSISAELLHSSCYDQVVVGLNTLATPIKPAYDWDDLVLPQQEVQMLKNACAHIRYRNTVYNQWGFGKKAAYGRGLSMLFSGPPGTGKTMAAQVVTNQLHMQMYKIQLSQIISKYIGETEKNLRQVFTEAKNANCILFFDEMDALFGKRSEVKDSHDRHANIETAYLLQQMEEYDGVVLMATNLLQNIDEAFMRRINFVISFPFPDVKTRLMLWEKMLDTKAPMSDDVNLEFLAENFRIAGGNIKNCVVHAAFLAAAEGSEISMRHLVTSVVNEQRKNNVVVLKEDLKEYADIVFGDG